MGEVSNIKYSDIKSVYTHVEWESGDVNNVIVVVSKKDNLIPPSDSSIWDYNSQYNESIYTNGENSIPVSSVVYNGGENEVTVYKLQPGTKYYFYFFEYELIGGSTVYKETYTTSNITMAKREAVQALRVVVTDSLTDNKIKDADISIINKKNHIVSKGKTDKNGGFRTIRLPVGGVHISASCPGYENKNYLSPFIKDRKNVNSHKQSGYHVYNIRLKQT